jgi:AbrB family looped-hinge helix DNA binding protein
VSKVTSKLQVTVPKALADQLGIRPGDEIAWSVTGRSLRVALVGETRVTPSPAERLALFDAATARQRNRQRRAVKSSRAATTATSRGWTRDELYDRGRTR